MARYSGGSLSIGRTTKEPEDRHLGIPAGHPQTLAALPHGNRFKRSTGTADKREAARRALPFIAQYDALIAALEAKAAAAVAIAPKGRRGPPTAAPSGISGEDLRSMAGEIARAVLAEHSLDPAPAKAFRLNSAIPPTHPGSKRPRWGTRAEPWSGQRFMLLAPKDHGLSATGQQGVTQPAQAKLSERGGIVLSEAHWALFCELVRDALDGAYAILQGRHQGLDWSEERLDERFPMGGPASIPRATITGLAQHWKAGKEKPDEKTHDRYARALVLFSEFLGHDDAGRIRPGDFQRWLVSLSQEQQLSAKTINEGYRAGVKACFAAGAEAGALAADPLAGVKFKIKADPTRAESRHPYTDDDASRLLSAARKSDDPAVRWLPWLMAYTGARIGEVAQLYRGDVRVASAEEAARAGQSKGVAARAGREGIPFLQITDQGEGQRLKNRSSRRDVPLHPAVIAEGFLEFVEKVPLGQFLFPDLTTGKYGHKGDGASRVYRKWARGDSRDHRREAHGALVAAPLRGSIAPRGRPRR